MSKKILNKVEKAIQEFKLIEPGDNVLVGMSGGKDSYTLINILKKIQKHISFDITGITINPGFDSFECQCIESFCNKIGVSHITINSNIENVVKENNKNHSFCSFCARLRRGLLYKFAKENNYNKIALGHHGDDFIQTLLMNMFYNGQLKAMSPMHISKDKKNIVIRPLVYVLEREIIPYTEKNKFPVCKTECPYYDKNYSKREYTKKLITDLEKTNPGVRKNMLNSLKNIEHNFFI